MVDRSIIFGIHLLFDWVSNFCCIIWSCFWIPCSCFHVLYLVTPCHPVTWRILRSCCWSLHSVLMLGLAWLWTPASTFCTWSLPMRWRILRSLPRICTIRQVFPFFSLLFVCFHWPDTNFGLKWKVANYAIFCFSSHYCVWSLLVFSGYFVLLFTWSYIGQIYICCIS